MSVLFLPEVRGYFDDLETILYENGYYSDQDNAHKYAEELFRQIRDNLPTTPHKPAPGHFDRFGEGMYYAAFRKNHQTVWYAFFTRYDDGSEPIYLVRYIANNHTTAQHL